MPRPTALAGALLAACLSLPPLAAAERTALAAIDYDTIRLVSGNDLMGTIESTDADGTLRVRTLRSGLVAVVKDQVVRIERRRSLGQAVALRGDEALAANDAIDLQRTLRFVADRQKDVKADDPAENAVRDAAIALAERAQARRPSPETAALVLPLLWERKDHERINALAEAGLKADPTWTEGWRALARVQRERGDAEGLRRVVGEWLKRQPTALEANQVLARGSEAVGDWKTAQEAWRKGFDLHQDRESALGLARTALHRGQHAEAVRAARALIAADPALVEAQAYLGSALLAQGGDDAAAGAALEQALAAKDLPAPAADLARYNLGLLRSRAGRNDEAAALWRQVADPAAALALARLEGRPVAIPANAGPALRALMAEYNALAGLQAGQPEAVQGLDLKGDARHIQLGQYAQVLRSAGADEAVKALQPIATPESQRWQAYGHLLANRLPQAEAILDRLPGNDGWAISARVYIAAARKDDAQARSWFQRLSTADAPPAAYVARLAAEFASALDEELREGFDWADAEAPATGWQASGPGTGIAARAQGSRLVLAGTQAEPVPTRVWRLIPAERLRAAQIQVDARQAGGAELALEIADEARRNGCALALVAGRLQARTLADGRWSAWQPVDLPLADPGQAVLRLEFDKGTFSAALAGDEARKVRLGGGRADGVWSVGVSGQAPRGTAWSASFDDLLIQLRPAVARR